jgi:hypothetical protein
LSRVRGIYEVGVYLEIIINNEESISEKFLRHCNTSRLKIAKSIHDEELEDRIKESIKEFQYEDDYLRDYQWARPLIDKKKITFKDLSDATNMSEFYYMYTYCCLSVHANILDSVNGIGLSELEKGKSVWVTTPSQEGIDLVIKVLFAFSNSIISSYFNNEDLVRIFIIMVFKNVIERT